MMKYCAKREPWLFMTPFGLPVVPPVYMMTQMSSELDLAWPAPQGLPAARTSSYGRKPSNVGLSTAKEI